MPRVKVGVTAHRRHKKILKLAKGYKGSKSKQFKKANETVMKALYYARRDRRAKKGNFRRLWIARINAAARTNGISYSKLINGRRLALKSTARCWLTSPSPMRRHLLSS